MGLTPPILMGIVGTGYVAKRRIEAIASDDRATLAAIASASPERMRAIDPDCQATHYTDWQDLITHPGLHVVIVATRNHDHDAITRRALAAGKHVVCEYPLSFHPAVAAELLAIAAQQDRLLHIEHIELLGGLHLAMRDHCPALGTTHYARYVTLNPQTPHAGRWSYNHDQFGFPLVAALSRIHRLTDLFGTVATVSCQTRYWASDSPSEYTACLCIAQLTFHSGLLATVTYGKGDAFTYPMRVFELHGDRATLLFDKDRGTLIQGEAQTSLDLGSRRGLFQQDTRAVVDYLCDGRPLYVQPSASLYALRVAAAAEQAARLGQTVAVETV
ncbi:Gfo/Idh/MocA family oxidoreductase [Spirulina major CS-329]|uniref:Gfo/Idh/MocA family protein n=1 Tax=Spirulina TaxID=1154 RepID=UPI00232D8ED3|nr:MULTISPECIES: Gfo/Idh/MocA family oxidoreductase [Spirulina]MDB9493534.1 Gfo/Idh/MocA family oxidoreductase [Spirulina subsalsa CS-330]MDB9501781.1 Gfo/Idh/MocA family oxidoreductase [Spirulina major CS-329]